MKPEEAQKIYQDYLTRMISWTTMMPDDDKQTRYYKDSLTTLVNMCMECDQLTVPDGKFSPCSRVIKVRTGIPNYVYPYFNSEKVMLSGVYIKVEGMILSKEYTSEILEAGHNKVAIFPEKDKFEFSEYELGSFRINPDGTSFVLKRSNVTDYIYRGSQYELFELTDRV